MLPLQRRRPPPTIIWPTHHCTIYAGDAPTLFCLHSVAADWSFHGLASLIRSCPLHRRGSLRVFPDYITSCSNPLAKVPHPRPPPAIIWPTHHCTVYARAAGQLDRSKITHTHTHTQTQLLLLICICIPLTTKSTMAAKQEVPSITTYI